MGLPGTESLESILTPYRDRLAYLVPMTFDDGRPLGNNGDRLMHEVFHRVLDEFGVKTTGVPDQAEIVIVPPNGALLEAYSFPDLLATRLAAFRDRPLVLFPSSALFPQRDPAFIFTGRTAETIWILREQYSFDHLSERWGGSLASARVTLILDHDIVASGHRHVPTVIGEPLSNRLLIIAAREDKEANTASLLPSSGPSSLARRVLRRAKSLVPHGAVYSWLARNIRRRKIESSSNRLLEKSGADRLQATKGAERIVRVDLSAPQYATFDRYRRTLAAAGAVVTDRLHVALPAAVLGKQVYLVEAGYHKLQGVYERSLSDLPNVELIVDR